MKKYLLCIAISLHAYIYHDFDYAMKLSSFPKSIPTTVQIIGLDGVQLYSSLKLLYEQYNPSINKTSSPKIPKIIHQIWIGGPVPDVFKKLTKTWVNKHLHNGWTYRLWTDEDIEEFCLYNQYFYDQIDNPGIRSDLLKWEIIYRHGGIYVDMDYECLMPLDELLFYDFFTAIQPLDSQFVQLGAALFAARPHHPILKHCIETIKNDWHHKGAPKKSGPVHFTKSFFAVAGKNGSLDIAFPSLYFYPQGCKEKKLDYEQWQKEGAYAIHHWAKSWMPERYRPQLFKKLGNEEKTENWND